MGPEVPRVSADDEGSHEDEDSHFDKNALKYRRGKTISGSRKNLSKKRPPCHKSKKRPQRKKERPKPVRLSAQEIEAIILTRHSIVDSLIPRYRKRFGLNPKDPVATARKMLSEAREDFKISPVKRIHRLINNNFVPARYFITTDGWRLVIIEEGDKMVLATIELAYGY
jgi:hypothetical protein